MKSYFIAAPQKSTSANTGECFYHATRKYIPVGSNDDFIISSEENGKGQIGVDDRVIITIIDMADPTTYVSYTYDYSNGCSGKVTPTDPVNLNKVNPDFNKLRGKTVRVQIEFMDICGGAEWGTAYYLTLSPSN